MTSSAVLITGGAKRLGREIALCLAEHGFDIALHYHTSRADAEQTQKDIIALGRKCELFWANLRDAGALPELIADALRAMPHCRHLVNNAAVFERGPFMEADAASFNLHMEVNFRAPVLLACEFGKRLQVAGSITNILDAKINDTQHNYFFYLLSKKALAEFCRMAAPQLAPNVRMNAVCPPAVMETSDGRHLAPAVPHPSPRDVAEAVHRLIASEITGECVFIK